MEMVHKQSVIEIQDAQQNILERINLPLLHIIFQI